MDFVYSDEKNMAHSASGRNVHKVADDQQITKLKDEHQKEIEKLKMEFKIQQLESENEKTLKIMQLEKEIQTLSHQFEMFKLKNSRESQSSQIQADQQLQKQKDELQNKLVEKEKQLVAKEHEMVLYKKEQEMETDAKENECKMKMKDLENEHKIKTLKTEIKLNELEKEMTEKEATVQHLNREIENLKRVIPNQNQAADKVGENMTTIDSLVWGAEYFHEGSKSSLLYPSYGDWYKAISAMMGNKQLFKTDKYLFMRNEFNEYHKYLDFVNRKDNSYEEDLIDFLVEDLKTAWENATFFLLHTKDFGKHLKFGRKFQHASFKYWRFDNVSKDFYFGDKQSAIVFGILK
ncbi:structural maintenance of chromosomes protein 3 homolog [Clytia hemisphaerica]|uniref:structural maintenance of chromosomes protein 3 homolog n=1 Tax=Clytia hemisphaerica TaxID=252671 RepID=UPI0034D40687